MSNNLFKKRVYGVVIVKSKLANYNADFTGAPRTLPDGTVYATDKVLKFKIRDYLEKSGKKVFVKTKYKSDGNPMTLKEVYEYHFGSITKNKLQILKNLLKMLDVRLFGVTFAPKGKDSEGKEIKDINISIHGPVQISYGVNKFTIMKDSGMFTDQIGSQFASKEGDSQTTLGAQTRSFEAHYVHHFSVNPKNLESFVRQVLIEKMVDEITITKKENKKEVIDINKINDKINNLENPLKTEITKTLEKNNIDITKWQNFIKEKIKDNFELFLDFLGINKNGFIFLSESDVNELKKAMQVAVTAYDSTSKKDAENEFLMWIELKEDENCSNLVLKNFSELIKIEKDNNRNKTNDIENTVSDSGTGSSETENNNEQKFDNGKIKIDLKDVFKYLDKFKSCIEKIEIYYDSNFNIVDGLPDENEWKIIEIKTLGKVEKKSDDESKKSNVVEKVN